MRRGKSLVQYKATVDDVQTPLFFEHVNRTLRLFHLKSRKCGDEPSPLVTGPTRDLFLDVQCRKRNLVICCCWSDPTKGMSLSGSYVTEIWSPMRDCPMNKTVNPMQVLY